MMKKFISIITAGILAISITGCVSNTAKKAVEEAKLAMADGNYSAVLNYGKLALDEGYKDDEFSNMIDAVTGYLSAKESFDSGNLEDAETSINAIHDYSNYTIAEDIDNLKQSISDSKAVIEANDSKLNEVKGLIDSEAYEEAQTLINEMDTSTLTAEQKTSYDTYNSTVTTKIAEQKAAAEKAAAEKAKNISWSTITRDKAIELAIQYSDFPQNNISVESITEDDAVYDVTLSCSDPFGYEVHTIAKSDGRTIWIEYK